MRKFNNIPLKNNVTDIIVMVFAIAFGISYRFMLNTNLSFPLNDGGMFHRMTEEILISNFKLPEFTSYNNLNIPFAYPPIGFYINALIQNYLKIDLLHIEVFEPLIFSLASLVVFYFVAKEVTEKKYLALSFLFFAITERSYEWQIMGGGVARSPGFFFSLVALFFFVKSLKKVPYIPYLVTATVFSSLTLLSHLEWLFFLLFSAFITAGYISAKKSDGFIKLVFMAVGTLLLTMPWWYRIIDLHGLKTFLSFFSTGSSFNLAWMLMALTTGFFTEEPFSAIIRVLCFIGILYSVKKNFFLTLWVVLPLAIFPRSYLNIISVPVSILSAIGVISILESIEEIKSKTKRLYLDKIYPRLILFTIILFILTNSFVNYNILFIFLNGPKYNNLTTSDIEAGSWLKQNVKTPAKFVVITSSDDDERWGYDKTSEWFPTLSGHTSIATPQGTEWLGNNIFNQKVKYYAKIKDCYKKDINCIANVSKEFNEDYSYIYIQNASGEAGFITKNLNNQLESSEKYRRIYNNSEVSIFEKGDTVKVLNTSEN